MNKAASNIDHNVYFSYSIAHAQSDSWKQVDQLCPEEYCMDSKCSKGLYVSCVFKKTD